MWFGLKAGPFVVGGQTPPPQTPTLGQLIGVLVVIGATFALWQAVWPLGLIVTLVEVYALGAVIHDHYQRKPRP